MRLGPSASISLRQEYGNSDAIDLQLVLQAMYVQALAASSNGVNQAGSRSIVPSAAQHSKDSDHAFLPLAEGAKAVPGCQMPMSKMPLPTMATARPSL